MSNDRPTRTSQGTDADPARTPARRVARGIETNLFLILLITLSVLLAQTVLQTMTLSRNRVALAAQIEQQSGTVEEAQRVRAQLEAIAGDTAILARDGNPNAIRLRDFLSEQGVTIRPPGETR